MNVGSASRHKCSLKDEEYCPGREHNSVQVEYPREMGRSEKAFQVEGSREAHEDGEGIRECETAVKEVLPRREFSQR